MPDTKANLQKWSDAWAKASCTLHEEWEARLTAPEYHQITMMQLSEMFDYAVENSAPSTTSGLIEMQKYFMKLRPVASNDPPTVTPEAGSDSFK